MQRLNGMVAIVLWTAATLASASAGSLNIVSRYSGTLTCAYGPGDYPNGPSRTVQISYGAPSVYTPDPRVGINSIDWLNCGDAVARHMTIAPTSQDHTIVIAGNPERALNVLLYPYLPSNSGRWSTGRTPPRTTSPRHSKRQFTWAYAKG